MLSELLTNSFCGSITLLLVTMSVSWSHSLPITVEIPVPTTPYTIEETTTDLPSSELLNNIEFGTLKPVKPFATDRKSEFLTIPIPSLATVLTAYDAKEKFFLDLLNVNATPLIDGIAEQDKYGNTGDLFYPVTRALVDNVQTFSNVWAKAAEVPLQILKKLTRKTSEKLNNFGARLVGLR